MSVETNISFSIKITKDSRDTRGHTNIGLKLNSGEIFIIYLFKYIINKYLYVKQFWGILCK